MSVKILIDMNLSPQWSAVFKKNKIVSVHWSDVGDPKAVDHVVMRWAQDNGHVVFTHDLDFGTLLALTQASSPSVIQIRTQNVLPEHLGKKVVTVLKQYEANLKNGALIVIDEVINRLRVLPMNNDS